MTDTTPILERFPIGSTVIWENKKWQDRSHFVIGRVLGRNPHQGNSRLIVRFLSIRRTAIGPVLFTIDKPAIKATSLISLADWYELRKGGTK